jgi:hypothetical protein
MFKRTEFINKSKNMAFCVTQNNDISNLYTTKLIVCGDTYETSVNDTEHQALAVHGEYNQIIKNHFGYTQYTEEQECH